MSILVYDGLHELIKREFLDRNMATTDNTVNDAVNLITTVMEDYRSKTLQLVGTELPSTGVAGTIYLQSKSEPNEKNRFIAYVFENGKFVQVGSSFFPEDFEHDNELNIKSKVTVENRVIKTAMDSKYDANKVINNVVYNDANSTHANDTPTSRSIQAALAPKLGYADGSRITEEQLWKIFRPELTRLVYPRIKVDFHMSSETGGITRLANKPIFSNLTYKSGAPTKITFSGYGDSKYKGHTYLTCKFVEELSDREIRIQLDTYVGQYYSSYPINLEAFFGGEKYPGAYDYYSYQDWSAYGMSFTFTFLDPVIIASIPGMSINLKQRLSGRYMYITTVLSDTGKENTYTTIQNTVGYNTSYTEGIPFYGFN